jgi:hypothetical protein
MFFTHSIGKLEPMINCFWYLVNKKYPEKAASGRNFVRRVIISRLSELLPPIVLKSTVFPLSFVLPLKLRPFEGLFADQSKAGKPRLQTRFLWLVGRLE